MSTDNAIPFEEMNLAQLIAYVMERDQLTYGRMVGIALGRQKPLTPKLIKDAMREPLTVFKEGVLDALAAALRVGSDVVAACAWRSLSYEDLNLSQLIYLIMKRDRLTYDALAAIARKKDKPITAAYLCTLVRHPLGGLRANMISSVAAALGLDETIVIGCAMRSWNYRFYSADGPHGSYVVLCTRNLTAEQANEVHEQAQQIKLDIERMRQENQAALRRNATPPINSDIGNDGAEPHDSTVSSDRTPAFSAALRDQRARS